MGGELLIILQTLGVDGEFFKQLPAFVKIIFIVLVLLAAVGIVIKYWKDAILILRGSKKSRTSINDLKTHSFYSKCDSWSKYKVKELYFGDDIRNTMFREIVSIKISVMSQKMRETVEISDLKCMNKKMFEAIVFKMITEMHVETERRILERLVELYPKNGSDIYELVMNHEDKGFNAFNQITDNYTERLVQIICESDMYHDNYEKMDMILDAFKASLGATFPHIESTFKGFNGQLNDIIKPNKK